MFAKSRTLALACLLSVAVLGWGSTAQAQFPLTGGGGELQIGTGLPLPIGTAGIFTGGMSPAAAGTFPPLLVPPAPGTPTIMQTLTGNGGVAMSIQPGVLSKPAAGAPVPIAVFPTNPSVFQVATSISYSWPATAFGTVNFAPGGGPGNVGERTSFFAAIPPTPPTGLGVTFATPVNGAEIRYFGGAQAFGGPGQFAINTGPGAAGGAVGPNLAGVPPVASVWINAFLATTPGMATMVALAGASNPAGLGQPGAPVASPGATTMWGPVTAGNGGGVRLVNQPNTVTPTMFTVGAFGTIPSSGPLAATFFSNMVTISKGFPWTTGLISLSAPATPPERFWLSGSDMRVNGVGNISLVSGSLSDRALSGPNANRGWLTLSLPEPTAALGAAAAIGMLGLCHGLVRRRSR